MCSTESLNLNATASGATTFAWSPAAGLSSTTIYNPTASPTVTTTYTVTASNGSGCSVSQTVTVTVVNCCENPRASSSLQMSLNNVTVVPIGTPGAGSWMNVAFGNTYYGMIELPPGGFPTGTYAVHGNLIINVPSTETVFSGCDIIFDDCSTLDQKTPVTIDRCYLHACKMWEGIASTNYLKVTNSIIEDARYGIAIGMSSHPGLVVDNCVFNKNYYGIGLAGAANFNTSSPNGFKVTGNIFTCKDLSSLISYNVPFTYIFTSSLIGHNNTVKGYLTTMHGGSCGLNPVRSEGGMFMLFSTVSSGNFFNIGNTSGGTNYFSYLNQGIYNSGTKIYVVNSNFQDITLSGGPAVAGILHDGGYPNTVTNVGDLNSSVKSCTFQNCEMGIKAFKGGNMNICSNNFNSGVSFASINTGIDVESWNDANGTVNIFKNNFTRCNNADLQALTNNAIKLIMQGNTSAGSGTYNVRIVESSPSSALYRVDGNGFSGKQLPIYLNGVINGNITDNTVDIANNTSNSVFDIGISNYNCKNCLFSGNTISSVNPNSNNTTWNAGGFLTVSSNGNTYCSNNISHVGICMGFQFNCIGSNIYGNVLNLGAPQAIHGIVLDNSATVGPIGVLSGPTWYSSENVFGNFSGQQVFTQGGSAGSTYYYSNSSPVPTTGGVNAYIVVGTSQIPGGPVCPSATFRADPGNLPHYPSVYDPSSKNYLKEEYYLASMFEQYRHILPDSVMNACAAGNIGKFFDTDSLMQLYVNSRSLAYLAQANAINSSVVPQNVIESNQVQFNTILQSFLLNDSTAMAGYLDDR